MEAKGDFASLLDDLFSGPADGDGGVRRQSAPFDYLAVAEELHSGRIRVSEDAVAEEYRSTGAGLAEEPGVLLGEPQPPGPPEIALSLEPAVIAAELDLAAGDAAGLAQARRDFAFRNHPDRVAPHLRERAMQRMQIANALIDDAQQRASGRNRH